MILSHSKKFIFFRVAKTGSTTAEVMLRLSNAFDFEQDTLTGTREWELPTINRLEQRYDTELFDWTHATPQDLIDLKVMTLDQLREYDCYAFVRPIGSRFVSGYMHCVGSKRKWTRVEQMGLQPHQFMERWRQDHERFSAWEIIGRKQVDWFYCEGEQIVTPLDFNNYENELQALLKKLDGNQFLEIPKLNRSIQEPSFIETRREWARQIWETQPEIQQEVLEHYIEDYRFYENNFGTSNTQLYKSERTESVAEVG